MPRVRVVIRIISNAILAGKTAGLVECWQLEAGCTAMDINFKQSSELPLSRTPAGRVRLVVQYQQADSDIWTVAKTCTETASGALLDALREPKNIRIEGGQAPSPPLMANFIELDPGPTPTVVPKAVESSLALLLSSSGFQEKLAAAIALVRPIEPAFQKKVLKNSRFSGIGTYRCWDVAPVCGYSRFKGISVDDDAELARRDSRHSSSVHRVDNLDVCREVLQTKFTGKKLDDFMNFLTVVKADALICAPLSELRKKTDDACCELEKNLRASVKGVNDPQVRARFLDTHPRLQALRAELTEIKGLMRLTPGGVDHTPPGPGRVTAVIFSGKQEYHGAATC